MCRIRAQVVILGLGALGACAQVVSESSAVYRQAALEAAAWLESSAIVQPQGSVWAADPEVPASVATDLYSGSSGVVLFFLEAHRLTGRAAFLDQARSGADYLLATLPASVVGEECGLYTGVAGLGFVLEECYRASKDVRYHQGALRCVDLILDSARATEDGATWSGVTDVISGSAGIGLFLLYAGDRIGHPGALDAAAQAGRELIATRVPTATGSKWPMSADYPRLMPNFSHGTAGVAYFLVELHRGTGDQAYLEAALSGATYLRSVTSKNGLLFHNEPDGLDLYYLGWCHGPPGTARLYYRLWQVTGEDLWLEEVHRAARAVIDSGIPATRPPGFWNNLGQCCGSAGVAGFLDELYRVTGIRQYRAIAESLSNDLLERATTTGRGRRWIHAEHRVRPDLLIAQTGFMQGAAGIGIGLLRLSESQASADKRIRLPDSPW